MSIFLCIQDKTNRKILINKIREYKEVIQTENHYLKYIHDHILEMDENELNKIMNDIDTLNKHTYLYFESILSEYETELSLKRERKIIPYKNFLTIQENEEIYYNIIGLTLSEDHLFDYYKDYDCFTYLKSKSRVINTNTEDGMPFFGCFPIMDDNILKDIKICVPKIYNLKSMLINIHEYNHGILLYPYLNQTVPDDDYEQKAKDEEEKFKKNYLKKIKI